LEPEVRAKSKNCPAQDWYGLLQGGIPWVEVKVINVRVDMKECLFHKNMKSCEKHNMRQDLITWDDYKYCM
jgi:hypothetical protein